MTKPKILRLRSVFILCCLDSSIIFILVDWSICTAGMVESEPAVFLYVENTVDVIMMQQENNKDNLEGCGEHKGE